MGDRPEAGKVEADSRAIQFFPMRFTDEELLVVPARDLTKQERARRRRIKRRQKELAAQQTKAQEIAKNTRRGTCAGFNRAGEPCKSYAIKGAKHCRAHLNDAEKAKLGMKSLNESGNEARRLMPSQKGLTGPQLMRKILETAAEKMAYRYFLALGFEFQGFDDEGIPIVVDQGVERGIRIHGESKDGDICMSDYPDMAAQIQIMEKLFDRIYGKPKQTTMIEGNPNAPIAVKPVRTVERSQQMADVLARVGAVPRGAHGGRQRSQPSEPSTSPADDSNVTPLHKD